MFKLILIKFFFAINLAISPSFAIADEFKKLSISFLGKKIGYIKLKEVNSDHSKKIRINGEIFSSPFSIFNGQFEYNTIITDIGSASSKISYESTVNATFKKRKIKYWVENGNLISVEVFPKKEQTKFTNPKQIDFEFIDPAYSITNLLSSPCKNSFVIYDGRRVIDIIQTKTASKFECAYSYIIRNGVGHFAPFNFKKFEISTFFERDGNPARRSVIVKTGPFKLFLNEISLVD